MVATESQKIANQAWITRLPDWRKATLEVITEPLTHYQITDRVAESYTGEHRPPTKNEMRRLLSILLYEKEIEIVARSPIRYRRVSDA